MGKNAMTIDCKAGGVEQLELYKSDADGGYVVKIGNEYIVMNEADRHSLARFLIMNIHK
ncbi:hypothetical protein [Bacillus thuringiensis]|uniref:hypothetical protein n=1 Tax=Bacillus thuringiensis TaxID=1428 RepID=UPI00159C3227|nr:hypothetical protein [Bacillus thuringiensis]